MTAVACIAHGLSIWDGTRNQPNFMFLQRTMVAFVGEVHNAEFIRVSRTSYQFSSLMPLVSMPFGERVEPANRCIHGHGKFILAFTFHPLRAWWASLFNCRDPSTLQFLFGDCCRHRHLHSVVRVGLPFACTQFSAATSLDWSGGIVKSGHPASSVSASCG